MRFREARVEDIPQMQVVRRAVKENALSDPSLIKDNDYAEFIADRGRGWVCEDGGQIPGFAFADLTEGNIWALFVHPDHERRGIGKALHKLMLDWYFAQGKEMVWLGTAPNTRAELFYRKQGWQQNGMHGKNEIKFEMSRQAWLARP